MDCNKDEAVRAKEIAQIKMENDDFEGALKFALKAQNLYSELDNIAQMVTTCSVHCSARNKLLGSEIDWYGILQIEKLSEESVVKKQYRKLALSLHPDKNRFPGAEAAFKLISQANAVLSDTKKKFEYDSRIKVVAKTARENAPTRQANWKPNKQSSGQTRVSNGYSNMNQTQASRTSSSVNTDTFLTRCPICNVGYHYLRQYLNRQLRCQRCSIIFIGCEVSTGGVNSEAKSAQPSAQNQREFSEPDLSRNKSAGVENTANGSGDSQAKAKVACPSNYTLDGEKHMNADTKKSSKKHVTESAESSDSESNEETPANHKSKPNQVHHTRRSSRKRGHVSYNESDEVDDLGSPHKRKRYAGSSSAVDLDVENNDAAKSGNVKSVKIPSEESRDAGSNKEDMDGLGTDVAVEISSDFSLGTSDDDTTSENSVCQCPDPEFSDFEKERDQNQFEVGQFWACYDPFDDMPRFYARVKNICASPFELTFTWLEADPIDEAHEKWINVELPVGCGRFKLGKTEKTSALPTFSHQMHCKKGNKRNSLFIYPREGEVWALIKDWDISWSVDPENHQHLKYEVVEVLSNFAEGSGIQVVHMNKINGFVSLFQRAEDAHSFLVKPHELYRFSHRVLCNKMTGRERVGVPVNSYELDPASLPSNPDDLHFPYNVNVGKDCKMGSEVPRTSTGFARDEGKSGTSNSKSKLKRVVNLEEIENVTVNCRRSPRGLNGVKEKAK